VEPGLHLWIKPGIRPEVVMIDPGVPWPLVWHGTRGGYWARLSVAGGVFVPVTRYSPFPEGQLVIRDGKQAPSKDQRSKVAAGTHRLHAVPSRTRSDNPSVPALPVPGV